MLSFYYFVAHLRVAHFVPVNGDATNKVFNIVHAFECSPRTFLMCSPPAFFSIHCVAFITWRSDYWSSLFLSILSGHQPCTIVVLVQLQVVRPFRLIKILSAAQASIDFFLLLELAFSFTFSAILHPQTPRQTVQKLSIRKSAFAHHMRIQICHSLVSISRLRFVRNQWKCINHRFPLPHRIHLDFHRWCGNHKA